MNDGAHLMNLWRKGGGKAVAARLSAAADAVQESLGNAGEYQLLYKYLRDRYANRVVLTFAEMEDLMGFALPESARYQKEWWGSTDPIAQRSAQVNCWTLAGRTAVVNL